MTAPMLFNPITFNESAELLLSDVQREAAACFAPRSPIGIADHAEATRILPKSSSSEGGPFRNRRVPYLRGVMDALTDPRVPTVVLMKGAQVAGTTVGENWVNWTMDESPAPMLCVWPTEKLLRRWSLTRLDPMIDASPRLAALFPRTGLRDSADAIAHKEFPGGTLDLLTARSSSDMRSISAGRIWFSEVDNILAELTENGDPIELARSRGETFWDYKEYFESTPTVSGQSRIWDEMMRSSWADWQMPCPHCDHGQVLRWRDGMEDGDQNVAGDARFTWDEDSSGEVIPGTVAYICEQCAATIDEWKKTWMLEQGLWVHRHPERQAKGFHVTAFMSPLISWSRIVQRFSRAKKSPAKMRTFVNNICGLPFAERSNGVNAHFLRQRVEVYRAKVPKGVRVLCAGGDVQGDYVVITVWGYGAGEESWVIDWKRIDGDPSLTRTWADVGDYLKSAFVDELGRNRYIAATCIDANYQGAHVHRFAGRFIGPSNAKVIPIIGRDGRGRPIIADPPMEKRRKTRRFRPSRIIGTDTGKDLLFGRLQVREPGPEYVHFSEDLDPAFFEQLTSEELKTVYRKKRPVRVYEKKSRDLANEALDTSLYAYGGLASLGARVLRDLARLAAAEPADIVSPATTGSPAAPARSRARPRVVSKGVY